MNTINPNDPAFPITMQRGDVYSGMSAFDGLTIREEIASRNMAGILSNVALDQEGAWSSATAIAEFALKCATHSLPN